VCAGNVIAGLVRDWGESHTTMVLRAITESSERNGSMLTRPVIMAVSDVLLAHDRWASAGLRLLEDGFDEIDLGKLWERAKATKLPARHAIATLLCVELERLLGPGDPVRSTKRGRRAKRNRVGPPITLVP
jgi:hypothetical protein